MSDSLEGTDEFQVRQAVAAFPSHYVSTSVERNSRGFTTTVKATVGVTPAAQVDDAMTVQRMQLVNNLLLAAGQLNIELRKLAISRSESMSSHEAAVEVAREDFKKWMAEFTVSMSE